MFAAVLELADRRVPARNAKVLELADRIVSKTIGCNSPCGFESHLWHIFGRRVKNPWCENTVWVQLPPAAL